MDLTQNALTVLEKRYLLKDDAGRVKETPEELFRRVADAVAESEGRDRKKWAAAFFELMTSLRFLPNSPTLMNAGQRKGQLSACFVLPVDDSLDGIFETLKSAAKIHQSGGGTGFAFSGLRASGSLVKSTKGVASGPLSFMRIFDVATETIKQGGVRRGANMAVLRVDHPDVLEFIDSKRDQESILNFNISVGVTGEFMDALRDETDFALRDPKNDQVVKRVSAKKIFEAIVKSAWECGDPGLIFLDRINFFNPTPDAGKMESTNPCITGDTRIWVKNRGLIPIRELVGSLPHVSTQVGEKQAYSVTTRVIQTGVKPVFRLKTAEGFELRLTADHRVMTEAGDVEAAELIAGDRIRLLETDVAVTDRDTRDARLGEVVGWLTGDGHFTHHGEGKATTILSFYGEDKREAAPRLLETVRELIAAPELALNSVEERDLQYIRSQRLRIRLADLGVGADCKKTLPEPIWRGSPDLVAGYLRGLFSADGSFQGSLEKGFSVRLASNELGLLHDVQVILLHLGVKAVIARNRRKSGYRAMPDARRIPREYFCHAQHELIISKSSLVRFAKAVGFLVRHKQDKLDEALTTYRRGPYRESFFATMSEFVEEGIEEVFDLTEPETSHFHAAGILVHNCGEQPLLPYESCNLGSLNLGLYALPAGKFNFEKFRADIHLAVRLLDDVIDANTYPIQESRKVTLRNRKIGLGVMGFADLLLLSGLPYASPEARELGEQIMSFLDREAKIASAGLAVKRGAFPAWKGSLWDRLGYPKMRNSTVSTVAPTGTISMIAGASSGIEPIFSGVFYRNVLDGKRLLDVHPAVAKLLQAKGISHEGLSDDRISQELGPVWSPARKVPVDAHVLMQAAFQRHSDSAVSKTINLPEDATLEDVRRAYLLAYRSGCKGITVYRDQSRAAQVLEKAES